MTPEEIRALDGRVCEFAGIPRERRFDSKNLRDPKDRAEIKAARSEMIYPPVLTEWGAAGRLMDALHKKGHKPCIMGGQDGNFAGFVYYQDEESDWARIKRVHPSGPMALVLAVNELTPIENTEK